MKYLTLIATVVLLSACSLMNPELQAHLEAEADFHANLQYRQDIQNFEAFRPEVYAEPEFLADCEYYQMMECYE